jgi:beta-xylosidase
VTLNGTSGDVPWADGNAWAPTMIERAGKYHLYFSGNNPSYDRKTIGAAVADLPEDPFVAEPTAMITGNESHHAGQTIDPAAFHDPVTGKYLLYWGNGNPLFAELDWFQ